MPASSDREGDAMPDSQRWKVGELAARTGLTVRTLHHYDAIGLLTPSDRTGSAHGSGHRLYTAADVARLHQVVCLKQLGFSLEQVREYMTRADYDPRAVVRLHLAEVRRRAAELADLGDRLQALAETLDAADAPSADTFLQTIEAIAMAEKYYTPEQVKQIQERANTPEGQEGIAKGPQMWADLYADVRAAMDAGTDPADATTRPLAERWLALVTRFTGGDPGLFDSLRRMYQNEDNVRGMDVKAMRPLNEYLEKVRAAHGVRHAGE